MTQVLLLDAESLHDVWMIPCVIQDVLHCIGFESKYRSIGAPVPTSKPVTGDVHRGEPLPTDAELSRFEVEETVYGTYDDHVQIKVKARPFEISKTASKETILAPIREPGK